MVEMVCTPIKWHSNNRGKKWLQHKYFFLSTVSQQNLLDFFQKTTFRILNKSVWTWTKLFHMIMISYSHQLVKKLKHSESCDDCIFSWWPAEKSQRPFWSALESVEYNLLHYGNKNSTSFIYKASSSSSLGFLSQFFDFLYISLFGNFRG